MNKEQIVNKQFTRAALGYDMAEVDSFLDEIIRDYDVTRQELEVARLRVKMLVEELEHVRAQARERQGAAQPHEGENK